MDRQVNTVVQQRPLDLEIGHPVEIVGQAQSRAEVYHPFGRVPLPPADTVAVIGLEDMVKIVITLAVGQKGQKAIVPGAV